MKIALVQCPLWGTYDPPLALAQLSSCLKEAGHRVSVFDLNIKLYLTRSQNYKNVWAWEQGDFWYKPECVKDFFKDRAEDVERYVREIVKDNIDVVGFSVNAGSRLASLEFARLIKKYKEDVLIVFGGPLFLRESYIEEIIVEDAVDVVIQREGEGAFIELLKAVEEGRDISKCRGIVVNRGGKVIRNEAARLIDMDSLPFLDFSSLPLHDYDGFDHIPFLASRGCIRRCIFCSDGPCWPGYRVMSGERIFREMMHHKKAQLERFNNKIGHVDFLDLVFNGNMKTLVEFCELMGDSRFGIIQCGDEEMTLDLQWTANMVIRPEMSRDVIKKMKRAGCGHIIFGLESGSEKVLRKMNKFYRIKDAERIIREMHDVDICVTGNFMFGFPGETEEDFEETLDFLRRNARYLSRVYPSRTYCALEEFSYLEKHLEEFGIKANPPNHLYWESVDGKNTYPVRIERCRRFCELALELGIEVGSGVQTAVDLDERYNLGYYYESKKEYGKAIESFLDYYKEDPKSEIVNKKLLSYCEDKEGDDLRRDIDKGLLTKFDGVVKEIKRVNIHEGADNDVSAGRLGREYSKALIEVKLKELAKFIDNFNIQKIGDFISLKNKIDGVNTCIKQLHRDDKKDLFQHYADLVRQLQRRNSELNDREFNERKIYLKSTPTAIFLQFAYACNGKCVFCSRGDSYEYFNLSEFQERIEKKIGHILMLAERFILTGSGEFLQLPQRKKILEYFDDGYPHVEKMFSTNGSSLTPEVCEQIISSRSRYSIHVSLHASNAHLHKVVTRMDNFTQILDQVRYLLNLRKDKGKLSLNFIFVATTLNIDDLPDFVRLAADMGVDKVICYYNYIYVPAQKYLSCFFKQRHANKIFDEAIAIARALNIELQLPPMFGLKEYPNLGICREPWSQIMLNAQAQVLPCDASADCDLRLGYDSFEEIWNSKYYTILRQAFVKRGRPACSVSCHRANPSSVNDFQSHVIHRGRKGSEINEFWEDNF